MRLSFQQLFFTLAFIFGLFSVMILAKAVLIPLSLALLLSFILFPITKKLEGLGINKLISAFISMFILTLLIGGIIALFSSEILNLFDELNNFSGKMMDVFTDAILFVNENLNFTDDLDKDALLAGGNEWLNDSAGTLIQNTFSSTASLLAGLVSTAIFTYLLLIYREG